MERKTVLFILSGLLFASFFVPSIEWGYFTMSGFDFVVSSLTPNIKYLLLIIPACALILLVSTLADGNSVIDNKLLLRSPFIMLILLLVVFYLKADSSIITGSRSPLKVFNLGLWIALTTSLILALSKRKELTH